jgi:DNA primase small subunit
MFNVVFQGTRSTCSTGCWFYMRVAVKVLTYLLRRCFGCKFIVPVFSGRRGVHVWCLDEVFLDYSVSDRVGLVERVELYSKPSIYTHPEHTPYLFVYVLQDEFYAQYIGGRVLVLEVATMQVMLRCCGCSETAFPDAVSEKIALLYQAENYDARLSVWRDVCSAVDMWRDWQPGTYEREVVFAVLFPRLDRKVTTELNHLIKSVFAIHPDTRRCSVPIPDIDTWRPDMAPRISEMVEPPLTRQQQQQQMHRPEWQMQKEAEAREAVLTQYVTHFCRMVTEAYPYRVAAPLSMKTAKFH